MKPSLLDPPASRTWDNRGVTTRLLSHLRTPLYRNGYALILSAVTTSALGLIYWAVAARNYPAEVVGLNSAVMSATLFLSGVAQLSFSQVLVRFIPQAGRATGRLIGYAYAISVATSVLTSVIFCLGLRVWSPALAFLGESPGWLLSFILVNMAWCIFALQDNVLTGLRQAVWVPVENILFAIVKIGLLVLVAGAWPTYGIFASWNISVALSLLPVNFLIFRYLIPRHVQATRAQAVPLVRRQLVQYMTGNHIASLFFLASTSLLPIMVANEAGASAAAYFYQPWMIASALQLVALNMASSLTVEASRAQEQLGLYFRQSLIQTLRVLVPVSVVIMLGAPYILSVFGQAYSAEGTAALRWLSLAALPNMVISLSMGLARVQNRSGVILFAQGAACILVLGLSYFLLPILGITGAGLARFVSQTLVAAVLSVTVLRPLWRTKV